MTAVDREADSARHRRLTEPCPDRIPRCRCATRRDPDVRMPSVRAPTDRERADHAGAKLYREADLSGLPRACPSDARRAGSCACHRVRADHATQPSASCRAPACGIGRFIGGIPVYVAGSLCLVHPRVRRRCALGSSLAVRRRGSHLGGGRAPPLVEEPTTRAQRRGG